VKHPLSLDGRGLGRGGERYMEKIVLERLFSIAIRREVEAHEFYLKMASRIDDTNAKDVFNKLAGEELGHKELLEKYMADPTLHMKFDAPPVDFKIAEATELPKFSMHMKPADAIALAMKKEQQAVEFYRQMAQGTRDADIKSVFEGLAQMELGHKARLESIFIEIGYPESF
jgi:rubrerythrin